MGITLSRTYSHSGIPIWQGKPKLYLGGFKLVTTYLNDGCTLYDGTPVTISETARTATVLKTARAYDTATNSATDYKVYKGHHFAVGDYFAHTVGGKAYAITAIDTTTSSDYDTISVGTTLNVVVAAMDAFFQSSATGASNAALNTTPNGLTYGDVTVGTNTPVSVAYAGAVYARRTPVPPTAQTALALIKFSTSS